MHGVTIAVQGLRLPQLTGGADAQSCAATPSGPHWCNTNLSVFEGFYGSLLPTGRFTPYIREASRAV